MSSIKQLLYIHLSNLIRQTDIDNMTCLCYVAAAGQLPPFSSGPFCLYFSQMTLPMLDTVNAPVATEAAAGESSTQRDLSLAE